MCKESGWHWLVNDGGPLIVLPGEAASHWEGITAPSNGRVVEAKFRFDTDTATDYDRACDVETVAALISVGASWGLVIDQDVPNAAWMKLPNTDTFFIVSVLYANDRSDQQIIHVFRSRKPEEWERVASELSVGNDDLILMHAADSLRDNYINVRNPETKDVHSANIDIGSPILYRTQPGIYHVDACQVNLAEEAHFTFFRFVQG